MKDKLLEALSFNTLGTILSFLGTLLISRFESVDVVGEVHYALSLAGLISILLLLIPPNYLVLKSLDNAPYVKELTGLYGSIACLILLITLVLSRIGVLPTVLPLFLLHRIVSNIVDISLQGSRKSQELYTVMFLSALTRLVYISLTLWMGLSIYDGYWIFLVLSSGIYIFWVKKEISQFIPKFNPAIITLFIDEKIKNYYQYDVIKNVRSNGTSVLIRSVLSPENYGIYSLFVKVSAILSGYFRIVETFIFTGALKVLDSLNEVPGALIRSIILFVSICIASFYVWLNSGLFLIWTSIAWGVIAVIGYEISSKRGFLMAKELLIELARSELIYCIALFVCLFSFSLLDVFEISIFLLFSILMQFFYVRYIFKKASDNL